MDINTPRYFINTVEGTTQDIILKKTLSKSPRNVVACIDIFIEYIVKFDKYTIYPREDIENMEENDLKLLKAAMLTYHEMNMTQAIYKKQGIDTVVFRSRKYFNRL